LLRRKRISFLSFLFKVKSFDMLERKSKSWFILIRNLLNERSIWPYLENTFLSIVSKFLHWRYQKWCRLMITFIGMTIPYEFSQC
jgi:hypothetical protein